MTSVLQLLNDAWRLYKENLSLFLGYSVWILVPYIFIMIVDMIPLPSGLEGLVLAPLYIAQLLLIVWATTAIVITTFITMRKKSPKLPLVGKRAWSKVAPLILVAILVGLVVLGGVILLIVPGFLFWVWYSFAQMEVILNKKQGWTALSASHDLVQGRFWPIAWRLIVGQLFLGLCYFFSIAILVALLSLLSGAPEVAFSVTEPPLWQDVLINIIEVVYLPLFFIYSTLLYLDVRKTYKPSSEL